MVADSGDVELFTVEEAVLAFLKEEVFRSVTGFLFLAVGMFLFFSYVWNFKITNLCSI